MGIFEDYQTKGGRCYRRVSVQFSLLYTVRPTTAVSRQVKVATSSGAPRWATCRASRVSQGSAVIRAEYDPESPALENLAVETRIPKRETHVLTIPDLPSLAGLVVEIGDTVEEGQLIARYVDDAALSQSELVVQEAKARLPGLERQIALARKAHQTKLRGIQTRLETAKAKLEEVRFLVAPDALPRARAVATEDAVAKLKQAEQEALTAWTSVLSSLQTQVQAARLSVRRAEAKKQQVAGKQWVKTPVAGLVADIRLVEVAVEGVTLEVLVERQKSNGN